MQQTRWHKTGGKLTASSCCRKCRRLSEWRASHLSTEQWGSLQEVSIRGRRDETNKSLVTKLKEQLRVTDDYFAHLFLNSLQCGYLGGGGVFVCLFFIMERNRCVWDNVENTPVDGANVGESAVNGSTQARGVCIVGGHRIYRCFYSCDELWRI